MNRQIIKYALIGLITLLVLQLITHRVYSEDQKATAIIEDLQLLLNLENVDSFAFNANIIYNENDVRSSFRNRFKDTIEHLSICELDQWYDYRIDANYLAIGIIDSSENNFIFKAHTVVGTLHYGESWYNEYIWILYRWFKLKHENTGVS